MASASICERLPVDSTISRWTYDVFLNFRGEDTRRGFTDHLYAALDRFSVYTFKDDEELRKGDYFPTQLLEAIEGSKISIVIISKTYASSSWCLEELVKILECKEMLNQVVLPIFYHVDPSQVRKQTGSFGYAFTQHEERFEADRIGAWKAALTKIAGFIGWHLKEVGDRSESEYINEIVEVVQQEVNHTYLNVAKHPVGIDVRVSKIHALLQSGAKDEVRIIGIYGMGGVGKTTLAKAIFNKIYRMFQGSSFLADVRSKGLDRLQEKLLCETLRTKKFEVDNVHRGISLVKKRLGLKKLLVVVDDVNHISQLEALVGERNWFGPGSLIIITTRDVHLLNCLEIDEMYEVERLSSCESLQVFSLHAFRNPVPLEAYAKLSNMIVSYAGGLPLALTVLGSHFCGRKSIQEWQDDFEKLRRIPHEDILKILKISYDALDDDTQRIFLDIACFFTGGYFDPEEIVKILNGCGFFAQSGVRILIDRCLLKEDLCMHDLIRDMGREIVRQESAMQPEKRSRLFLHDEVLDVLVSNKGTEAIETMVIDLPKNVNLSTEVFSKMTRLRVLKILSMAISGPLKYLSNELRLFYWRNCPLRRISSDLCLNKLVILEITSSNIEEFQPNLQHFRFLDILRLDFCEQLKRAPNFTGAHSIKTLSLYSCSNLVELPQSIGDLKNLVKLQLGYCKNLKMLPSSICKLISLEYLGLEECSKIKELPTNLGKLEQLRQLDASETSVTYLPISCGSLRYLNYLALRPLLCPQESVEPIGHLASSYANLCSLRGLCAPYHYLQHLELQIGHGSLSFLTFLDLSHSYFNTLPFNFCHLSRLRDLILNNCKNLQVIQDLPSSLHTLSAENCLVLEKASVLSGIEVRSLKLPNCSNLVELRDLENLTSLEDIDIRNCSTLSSNSCFVNLFKAHFQKSDLQQFTVWVSKDMIPEYLWCNEVVGSSSNYKLPLFLEEKLILIVLISRGCVGRCFFKNKTTGVELLIFELGYPLGPHNDDMVLECKVYDHFTEPIKVEELEVFIELYPLRIKTPKENLTIHTCIVYADKDGELYFFPVNVEIKFPPGYTEGVSRNPDSNVETEQHNRRHEEGSCIWDVLRLQPLFGCLGFSGRHN